MREGAHSVTAAERIGSAGWREWKPLPLFLVAAFLSMVLVPGTAAVCRAGEGTVRLVTEEIEPLVFRHDGDVRGYAAEVVTAALKEAGIDYSLEVLPWSRAFDRALKDRNVFIFPMVRTPEREGNFTWIQPLAPARMQLFRLVSRADLAGIPPSRFADYRFVTVRGYFTAGFLARWGVPAARTVLIGDHRKEDMFRHLELGRSDFYLGDPLVFDYEAGTSGKLGLFTAEGEPQRVSDYYLAANPGSDAGLLEKVRGALSLFFASGRNTPYRDRYFKASTP